MGEPLAPVVEVHDEAIEVHLQDAGTADDLVAFAAGRPYALHFERVSKDQLDMFDEPQELKAYVAVGNEVRKCTQAQAEYLFGRIPGGAIIHDSKPIYKLVPTQIPPWFDTMLACYVLQSGRSSYDVRDCIQGYLD